ncbi:hypothetical protein M3Y94_00258300 [Aphelenchoides besseyi]|nr:hypothetical protein M3Y94_00258300 [Aphelenchoides besseyi]
MLVLEHRPNKFFFAVAPDYEDVLVVGESCVGIACKQLDGNRTIYKPSKSNTANDTGFEVKSRYDHSIVLGEYITEKVTVDNLKAVPLEIGVLKRASPAFYHLKADGVFGLSLKNYYRSNGEFKSALHSLLKNADTPQATVWIKNATSNVDRYGHLTFGGQSDKCKGSPQFYPKSFEYSFNVDKFRFGTVQSHRSVDSKIDFTSRFISIPSLEYQLILRAIGINNPKAFSCSSITGIDLQLKIGGTYYSISPFDYTYKDSNGYCNLLLIDNGNYYNDGNGWILGYPFLINSCVTFNLATLSVGFSPSLSDK